MKHERAAYDALLQVKTPKSFANALDKAADSHMMSRSDFIRVTLADRLKADGVEVTLLGRSGVMPDPVTAIAGTIAGAAANIFGAQSAAQAAQQANATILQQQQGLCARSFHRIIGHATIFNLAVISLRPAQFVQRLRYSVGLA
jgi:hypothetical protein